MLRLFGRSALCRRSAPHPPPFVAIRLFSGITQTEFEALRDLLFGLKSDLASFKAEAKSDTAGEKSGMASFKAGEKSADAGFRSVVSEVKPELARIRNRFPTLELPVGHKVVPVQHPISVFIQSLECIVQKELEPVREEGVCWSAARTLTLSDNAVWPTISSSVLYQRYFYKPFYEKVLNELRPQLGRNPMQACVIGSPGIGTYIRWFCFVVCASACMHFYVCVCALHV
jgi:hypothetical protein